MKQGRLAAYEQHQLFERGHVSGNFPRTERKEMSPGPRRGKPGPIDKDRAMPRVSTRLPKQKRPTPDAKIVPFPDNWQPGAIDDNPHQRGPDHNRRPLTASNIVMINNGGLICSFDLSVPLWGRDVLYIIDCKLVQGKTGGQRVFLPYRKSVSA